MGGVGDAQDLGQHGHGLPRRWYLIPTAVLLLGALSVALLIWAYRIGERQRLTAEHVDALMDIQVKTAVFHLWLEEALAAGSREEIERSFADLDAALLLSAALVEGGESEHRTPLSSLRIPSHREAAESVRSLLSQLKEIALRRAQDPAAGGIGSSLDEEFDVHFREILRQARNLELTAERQQIRDRAYSRRLYALIIPLWAVIVAGSIGGVCGWELWRRRAELALEKAYVELDQRVQSRTAELSEANDLLRWEIIERKSSEAFLRQSERDLLRLSRQFNTLLDAIPDSIALVSSNLRVVWANKGASSAKSGGQDEDACCYTLWYGASAPCANCPVLTSFRTGRAEETRITRSDGSIWDLRAFPMRDEGSRIESVIEVATEVTEKLALQAETQRTAHLASIGELAAGVAHEINNPINGVINYAQIMMNESGAGSAERELAERIVSEGRRIAGIVQGLLSFARHRQEGKRLVPIGDILRDSLTLMGSQMQKEGIRIVTEAPQESTEIFANQQQLQQVFMNMLSNARHALNQRYSGADPDKILGIAWVKTFLEGKPAVRITFVDHGVGIAPELMDKIMHPFFTTKGAGEGTGLGLSISHGIVAGHGGRLTVQSSAGEYTKVLIDLPAGEAHA